MGINVYLQRVRISYLIFIVIALYLVILGADLLRQETADSQGISSADVLGKGGLGTSMATVHMDSLGLFSPHSDSFCDDSEVFVPLWADATLGFCIERNERVASFWNQALQTCLRLDKRLPEPWEWQTACDNAGALGIQNMTNNYELASNFPSLTQINRVSGVGVAVFGAESCGTGSWHWLGSTPTNRPMHAFRCVH